jgi:hypothetical protein
MTYLNGDIFLEAKKHRLYPYFENLLIITACINRAIAYTAGKPVIMHPNHFSFYHSRQFQVTAILPTFGPIELALKGSHPRKIQVTFVPRKNTPWPSGIAITEHAQLGMNRSVSNLIFVNTIVPVFTTFFENNMEWMLKNINSDKAKWSGVFGFARVIRNAISHGGAVKMVPRATPVKWHHVAYGHAQNKKKIIGTDLIFGDFMILMFELSNELDRRGCPI